MKKEIFAKLYLIILIISSFVLFTNCGTTPQLPKEVCTYTDVICDYSDLICQYVPESCWYINIACMNLNILCSTTATQPEKEAALKLLQENNKQLKQNLQEK